MPLNATATATLDDLDRCRRDVARRTERLPEYVFVREDGRELHVGGGPEPGETGVGKILGHSTPIMTQRYAHVAPDHLRGAVAALDGSTARMERFWRHEAERPARPPAPILPPRLTSRFNSRIRPHAGVAEW